MSFRFSVVILSGLLSSTIGRPVQAGLLESIFRDIAEQQRWPRPYNCWDRDAARAPFPTMIHNGWRRQNLLADHDFSPDGTKLSSAGQAKVRWILTQAPLEHRSIFVRRAETAEQTAARINAVRDYAAKVAPDGGPPNILETHLSPAGYPVGWPASKDASITRHFQSFVPDKLYLPERSSSSSGQ